MKKRVPFLIVLVVSMLLFICSLGVFADDNVSPAAYYQDPLAVEQWSLDVIQIEKIWQYYTCGSKDVVVCVIDSGFWVDHPDAGANFKIGKNYVEEYELNPGNDDTSHGTSVAGLIGASSGNGIGISGLLQNVTVVSQKAFYWDAEKKVKVGPPDAVAAAIRDAVDEYDADIINMSFLYPENHKVIEEACEYAASKGAILIAAAGNHGHKDNVLLYPASYSTVIGVGSVGQTADGSLEVAHNSARNGSVYCCAPGVDIRTLKNPYSKEDEDTGEYRFTSGTSLATPHVAGLAALALSYKPDMDPATFRTLLKSSCTDLGTAGYDTSYGYGLINYEKFFRLLDGNVFDDVAKKDWFHDAVVDVYQNNLMRGMEDNFFGPNVQLTRCMFITILHRMEGTPASSVSIPFTDVPSGSYYEQAVKWAYENKISEGISKTEFGSDHPIRREEVVTMLYRYFTNYKEQTLEDKGGNTSFADAADVDSWAKDAVTAMAKAKVLEGYSHKDDNGNVCYTFLPQRVITRAEAASLISRLQ
ncbi:MAG: S8 family serine peptidase [Firmicutes bacterium]|nr:S8 family serine peptidase [Bacillota bacterium]